MRKKTKIHTHIQDINEIYVIVVQSIDIVAVCARQRAKKVLLICPEPMKNTNEIFLCAYKFCIQITTIQIRFFRFVEKLLSANAREREIDQEEGKAFLSQPLFVP